MTAQTRPKKPTNLSIDQALLREARGLGVNLSQAAEAGLRQKVQQAKAKAWVAEHKKALDSSNAWVQTHGLPLAKYRQF